MSHCNYCLMILKFFLIIFAHALWLIKTKHDVVCLPRSCWGWCKNNLKQRQLNMLKWPICIIWLSVWSFWNQHFITKVHDIVIPCIYTLCSVLYRVYYNNIFMNVQISSSPNSVLWMSQEALLCSFRKLIIHTSDIRSLFGGFTFLLPHPHQIFGPHHYDVMSSLMPLSSCAHA